MDSIIFDVDGTIWNSTDVVAQAWNEVLEKEKIDIRVTADQLKGFSEDCFRILRKRFFPIRQRLSSFGSLTFAAMQSMNF